MPQSPKCAISTGVCCSTSQRPQKSSAASSAYSPSSKLSSVALAVPGRRPVITKSGIVLKTHEGQGGRGGGPGGGGGGDGDDGGNGDCGGDGDGDGGGDGGDGERIDESERACVSRGTVKIGFFP